MGSLSQSQILERVQVSLGSQRKQIHLANELLTLSVPVINIWVLIFAAYPKVQLSQQIYSRGSVDDALLSLLRNRTGSSRSITKRSPVVHGSFLGHYSFEE